MLLSLVCASELYCSLSGLWATDSFWDTRIAHRNDIIVSTCVTLCNLALWNWTNTFPHVRQKKYILSFECGHGQLGWFVKWNSCCPPEMLLQNRHKQSSQQTSNICTGFFVFFFLLGGKTCAFEGFTTHLGKELNTVYIAKHCRH